MTPLVVKVWIQHLSLSLSLPLSLSRLHHRPHLYFNLHPHCHNFVSWDIVGTKTRVRKKQQPSPMEDPLVFAFGNACTLHPVYISAVLVPSGSCLFWKVLRLKCERVTVVSSVQYAVCRCSPGCSLMQIHTAFILPVGNIDEKRCKILTA